ncbi:sensor domain-containing diguanylate cyclase [Legionella erythra]|uniref:Fused adenylate cyclase/two component hybrid sensor/regulator n=1 Tax=Legionella erythra TaxID=448 RepID=A0A0W0TSE7_LEGER|nr:sensor domain-containing diguanylate cyclase [Legionella erythra]KTC98578.1 fused adenylate cyclase/two component hybrid sensor/regulator [Legionella erythra]
MGQKALSSDIHIITQQLSKIIDTPIEESLTRLVALGKRMFDVPIVAISLFDEKRQKFNLINFSEVFSKNRDLSLFTQYINDDILIVEDTHNDERFIKTPLILEGAEIRFYVSCPIYSKKRKKIGAIVLLDNKPRTFCLTDLSNLNDIIKLAEAEINNCRLSKAQKMLLDEMTYDQRLDYTDQKTRAWNFAGFKKIVAYQLSESLQTKKGFGLVSVDIDGLKAINEHDGFEIGDDLLRKISKTLMRTCRAEDTIARSDFCDFIILIHTDNTANIRTVVDRIQHNLSLIIVETPQHKVDFSVTIGYTCFDPQSIRPEKVLMNAEIALLKGKRTGRNCIYFYEDEASHNLE